MSTKIKVSIQKRGDRIASIDAIQNSYNFVVNKRTFANYRSILNKINASFGWKPDHIYYDRMNDKKEEIAQFCLKQWNVSNVEHLQSIMRIVSSLMTRTGFGDRHDMRSYSRSLHRIMTVPTVPVRASVPDWKEIQPRLAMAKNTETVAGKIAAIFSYGYVLRVGEMFDTKLVQGEDEIGNYLDLDNCVWHIMHQKNGKPKSFEVEPELCKFLKDGNLGTWLLGKNNGQKYSKGSQLLKSHKWKFPSNNDLRKSYETWNIHDSGRTPEEIEHWHMILGHVVNTVDDFYDQVK